MPQITIDCGVTVNVQWNYRRIVLLNWIGLLVGSQDTVTCKFKTNFPSSVTSNRTTGEKENGWREIGNLLSPDTANLSASTAIEQILASRTPLCPLETGAAWLVCPCACLWICVFCFLDEVSPLTTYRDSSHICVCSDAPNRHQYPCAESYGGFSGVRHNNRTFAVFKKTHLHGVFSHLHSWDHRRRQHCFCEADGGDYLLVKCHTNIPCVKRLDSPVSLGATGDWCIIC